MDGASNNGRGRTNPRRQKGRKSDPRAGTADVVEGLSSELDNTHISNSQSSSTRPELDDELVDTKPAFQGAVQVLSTCQTLIVDCEGLNLGVRGGALSVLSIRSVSETPHSYLFDIILLERAKVSLQPVFELLSSTRIRKVFYDGRMDFCALYYRYNVPINNVIDLQIADVESRLLRGEIYDMQMRRLLRCLSHNQVLSPKNTGKYANVHLLQGLGTCLVEHEVAAAEKGQIDHSTWMIRPLTDQQRFYAANDVYLISLLLKHFETAEYLSVDLPLWSQRYISIWSDYQPLDKDIYRSHPLLPLEILRFNPATVNASLNRRCDGCQRMLSMASFPMSGAYGAQTRGGRRFCFVCMAVPFWIKRQEYFEEMKRKRKEEKEKREAQKRGEEMAKLFGSLPSAPAAGPVAVAEAEAETSAKTPPQVALKSRDSGLASNGDGNIGGTMAKEDQPQTSSRGRGRGRGRSGFQRSDRGGRGRGGSERGGRGHGRGRGSGSGARGGSHSNRGQGNSGRGQGDRGRGRGVSSVNGV